MLTGASVVLFDHALSPAQERNLALLLAISSYPNDFPELRSRFEAHGCILADYSDEKGWKSTLDSALLISS